jgi:TrmH family RNA methyltransferase
LGALSFRSGPVQRLRRLASRRADRWQAGCFVAEGAHLLDEALRAGASVEAVFVDRATATGAQLRLAERAAGAGAAVHEVAPGVLSRVGDTVTPQPLTAIVRMHHLDVEGLAAPALTVVCAGVSDPGNAGTIVRSALAAGCGAVVFCAGAVDMYNPKAVRASAGALFHLALVAGPEPAATLDALGGRGLRRVATVARGGTDHDRVDWTAASALVLGSESHGLPDGLAERIDEWTTIPMDPASESLNVAMAATVICFEAARQRRAAVRGAACPTS